MRALLVHRLLLFALFPTVLAALLASPALAVQDTNVAVSVVTPSTAIVVVKTDIASDVSIEYGSAPGIYSSTRTSSAANRHEVQLDSLSVDSTVYYRVSIAASGNPADAIVLPERTFSTTRPPGSPFRFGVLGDNRPSPASPISQPPVFSTIIGQMAGENLDFALHAGDLIFGEPADTDARNEQKYNALFSVTGLLTDAVPMYTAVGNHEWISYAQNRAGYEREFALPVNNGLNAATDGEEYYSFENGDTHFIVLCTEIPGQEGLVTGAQFTWLRDDLTGSTKPWTIVILHRPLFGGTRLTEPWFDPGKVWGQANRDAVLTLFEQYGVDLVFAGHEHFYHHHVDNGIHYVISGGAGSPLYDLPLLGPGDIYGAKVNHHVIVEETSDSLAVTAIDSSGNQLESFTLGEPTLMLSQGAVYWNTFADYTTGLLSVDFVMGNSGPGDAQNASIVYLSSSNGVTPYTDTPVVFGDLKAGQNATATVQYVVPPSVKVFRATNYATCEGLSGGLFAFPGPPPGF